MPRTPLARQGRSPMSPHTSSARPPMQSRLLALRRRRARARMQGASSARGSATSSRSLFASSCLMIRGCGTTSVGQCLSADERHLWERHPERGSRRCGRLRESEVRSDLAPSLVTRRAHPDLPMTAVVDIAKESSSLPDRGALVGSDFNDAVSVAPPQHLPHPCSRVVNGDLSRHILRTIARSRRESYVIGGPAACAGNLAWPICAPECVKRPNPKECEHRTNAPAGQSERQAGSCAHPWRLREGGAQLSGSR